MKKIFTSLLAFALVFTLVGCSDNSNKTKLRVFNWGEYVDKSLIKEFEKENDCKVIYETFDSNESMYTKLQGGNEYDILVPSEYMIERLIKEEMLQPLDWAKLPSKSSLIPEVMNLDYDPDNKYSAPNFYGNVGIVYDKTVVDAKDLKAGWEILRNTKYKGKIYMYDSERDSFMVALKALGYSMNTTNETEINKAYNWLVDQKSTMDPVYSGDDIIDNMRGGEKAMAVIYSGDAAAILEDNEDMAFFLPDEGTNLFFDAYVITKNCTETDLAHKFIEFMISDYSAYANTIEVGYTTTNGNAQADAKKEIYSSNNAYDVRLNYEADEVFNYQDKATKELFSTLWTKAKAS